MERFVDLPVCVDLPGRLGQEVAAFVEAEAGWQVIAEGGPLAPVFTLGAPGAGPGRRVAVLAAPAAPETVRDAMLSGALDVIAWPDDRDRLLHLPRRIRRSETTACTTPLLRVAGCRGGVGTSTVALAAGAMVAWSGRRALVVGDDAMLRLAGTGPWEGPGSAELVALGDQACHEVERLALAVPGIQGLAVLGGGRIAAEIVDWPYDLVVVDEGVAGVAEARLVVAAADASVGAVPAAAPVVVVEHGPLDRHAVTRCMGREPAGWVPYSNRVARAGSAGRVPSALPGSWVQTLRGAIARARP